MSWTAALERLLSATAAGVEASLGLPAGGSLAARIIRGMQSYEGRDMWRPTFAWHEAVRSELIARRAPATYDIAIVGGGPLALHVSDTVRRLRPGASVIAVNAGLGSRTYEAAGRAFCLNTDSSLAVDRHPLPGVRLGALCGERFAPGLVLADAIRVATLLSGTDVWSWACATRLEKLGAAWRLGVDYGGTNHDLTARDVVIATGFGEPRDALFAPELRATASSRPSEAPAGRCFTGEAFLAHAAWGSLAQLPLRRMALIGSGPSALAVLSVVLGPMPSTMDHIDLARARAEARVTWYLGNHRLGDVMGWGGAGTTDVHAMLHDRYAELLARLRSAIADGSLEVVSGRPVERVTGTATRPLVDGRTFDTVVDCSGYAPYQFDAFLPGFSPAEVVVDADIAMARGCYLLGDSVLPLVHETADEGPLQQWTRAAIALGERLAHALPDAPAPPPPPREWTPVLEELRLEAPVTACVPTAAERIGADLAVRSAAEALPAVVREAQVSENRFVAVGAVGVIERAIGSRTLSVLLSTPRGAPWA